MLMYANIISREPSRDMGSASTPLFVTCGQLLPDVAYNSKHPNRRASEANRAMIPTPAGSKQASSSKAPNSSPNKKPTTRADAKTATTQQGSIAAAVPQSSLQTSRTRSGTAHRRRCTRTSRSISYHAGWPGVGQCQVHRLPARVRPYAA